VRREVIEVRVSSGVSFGAGVGGGEVFHVLSLGMDDLHGLGIDDQVSMYEEISKGLTGRARKTRLVV
jgi:hypothetical protein